MSLHSDTTSSCKTLLSQCEIDISSRFAITSERICVPVCTHASVRVDYTLKKGCEYTGMRGTHTEFFPVASIISTYLRHNEQWVWHIMFYCNIILLWLLRCGFSGRSSRPICKANSRSHCYRWCYVYDNGASMQNVGNKYNQWCREPWERVTNCACSVNMHVVQYLPPT